jgi:NAD(P)-dependent dehydrogenase (short-subunit alcohol dehydrogenase family)
LQAAVEQIATAPSYAGKWVLVTRGTSGIGAAVARAFALSGAHVTATGVAQREIDALAGDADFAGAELGLLDVRDAAAIGELVGKLPALDILVNCAGMIRRGEELDSAVFEQVLDVNLRCGCVRRCGRYWQLWGRGASSILVVAAIPLASAIKGLSSRACGR